MTREFERTRRVGEQIRREMAAILLREVNDPRLSNITISAVEVSRDLAHAKVYVSSMAVSESQQVVSALEKAGGFLRSNLARRVKLRSMPQLHFIYDTSIATGERMDALIEEAVSHDEQVADDREDDSERGEA